MLFLIDLFNYFLHGYAAALVFFLVFSLIFPPKQRTTELAYEED